MSPAGPPLQLPRVSSGSTSGVRPATAAVTVRRPNGVRAAVSNPWTLLGWLLVTGFILLPLILLTLYLVPALARVETGTVLILYDNDQPITAVTTPRGGKRIVNSNPLRLRLPPGAATLQVHVNHNDQTVSESFHVLVKSGRESIVDVTKEAAAAYKQLEKGPQPRHKAEEL